MKKASHSPLEGKTYGIGLKDKVGYALGDAAGVMTFALVGSFLQMFYTNVLFIDEKKVMVLFIVARLWDAVNDPMWGAFVDHRGGGKNGKFRPYLRWFSTPLAIFGVLMFVKIPGLTEMQYLIYAYITYIGYGMLYTVVNIPYGSMASVITTDLQERSALSMFRSVGAGLGGLPAQIILPLFAYTTVTLSELDENGEPLTKKILHGDKLLIGVIILAVISVVVYQLCYKMTTERVTAVENAEKKIKTSKTIKALFKNRPFIALCIASMLLIAVQQFTQTAYNYLFLDYFKQPKLYALVTVFTYLPMALLLPVLQKIVRRFGKKEVCAIGMVLSFAANLVLWLIGTKSVAVFFALCFVSGLGMTFFVLEVWALVTDVIDYHEILSGQRDEGTSYAFFSFTRKLGQTIAGVLGTGILTFAGYNPENVTAEATKKLYNASTAIPAVMCLVMALTLGVLYPLTKKKLEEMHSSKSSVEE